MAKIKYTKNELKTQRNDLERFRRFLPTLQLKKRQLQAEVRSVKNELKTLQEEYDTAKRELAGWQALFSEPVEIGKYLQVSRIEKGTENIVGVNVPVLREVIFERTRPDYFADPMWLDDGLDMLERLVRLKAASMVMAERLEKFEAELTITTQRVNLFEKVKIPEARDNIRRIRIFLGDQQTAAVARAKIAKRKLAGSEGFI